MLIGVCTFTETGSELTKRILSCSDFTLLYREEEVSVSDFCRTCFEENIPLLFVGACGIAVRMIAPFVNDKLRDIPVIVMDEKGEFAIPILSGHMGGANDLAKKLADAVGAKVVLTTATDVEKKFSVDTFAKRNGFRISNREAIKTVSSKVLRDQKIKVFIDSSIEYSRDIPKDVLITDRMEDADVIISDGEMDVEKDRLLLIPKKYVVGIGCKKDKDYSEIKNQLKIIARESGFDVFSGADDIYALASIDLKAKEAGLLRLACNLRTDFITYSAEELSKIKGDFEESPFVKEVTGVGNVCERAAVLAAGYDDVSKARMQVGKIAESGITFCLVERKLLIDSWETN